ncbi:MAG: hypothetical protein ABJG78_07600 [Cyclobacteriaceae bacterium]
MIGVLITARLGSTRLSNKHLIKVEGRTFMEWLIERFYFEFVEEISKEEIKLFIATSDDSRNLEFNRFCKDEKISVFFGSDENIPLRHLQCATKNNLTHIISIDGDDILCSTYAARLVFEQLVGGKQMVATNGLPLGMNVTGYSTSFLKESIQKTNTDNEKLETGWGRIFDQSKIQHQSIQGFDKYRSIRMTLDYPDDGNYFKAVIEFFGEKIIETEDQELLKTIFEDKLYEINAHLNEEYWNNFNEQKNSEEE